MSSGVEDLLGLRILRAVLDAKDFDVLDNAGFQKSYIIPGKSLDAFEWVQDYVFSKKSWPATLAVNEECDVRLPDEVEDIAYLVEQIENRHTSFQITQALKGVAKDLDAHAPDLAMARLTSFVSKASIVPSTVANLHSLKSGGLERITQYDALAALPTQGILSPWDEINGATQGFVDGTLTVVMAKPNVGKTWWSCIVANHALTLNYDVLYVSLEMPTIRIARRLDAIRYKIPFGGLRNADMDPTTRDRWETAIKADTTPGELWVADKQQVETVTDVMSLVNHKKPAMVVVDGGYRFAPSGKTKSGWEGTVSVVNDLQRYAELSNIPWVVTTQFGDSNDKGRVSRGKKGPKINMWGVRYGKEWVINPDVVLALHQEPEDRATKQLRLYVTKVRDVDEESMIEEMLIAWDLTDMKFHSLSDPTIMAATAEETTVEFS
tara:strand:+ start:13806 stop:15113 length:1308 start_codon:yes stop_codon:yes gene_type:complete